LTKYAFAEENDIYIIDNMVEIFASFWQREAEKVYARKGSKLNAAVAKPLKERKYKCSCS